MKPVRKNQKEDLFSISKDKMYVVAQKNDLIQKARHELTTKELKLVDFMISKVKASDEKLYEVKTSIQEINEVMEFGLGGLQVKETTQALLNLRNKGFFVEMLSEEFGDKKPIVTTSWLGKAIINPDNTCILKLDEDLVPYLLNIVETGGYTQFYLREIVSLKSKYSLLLYRLAKSFYYLNGFGDTTDEFKEYFGKEKDSWGQFNQKYLKPAVEEINDKTDMFLTVRTEKRGKRVSEVYVFIEDKKKINIESKQIPKVPLHNWLEN